MLPGGHIVGAHVRVDHRLGRDLDAGLLLVFLDPTILDRQQGKLERIYHQGRLASVASEYVHIVIKEGVHGCTSSSKARSGVGHLAAINATVNDNCMDFSTGRRLTIFDNREFSCIQPNA